MCTLTTYEGNCGVPVAVENITGCLESTGACCKLVCDVEI